MIWDNLMLTLRWHQDGHDGVSNHQPHNCLLKRLFMAQIKENIKASRHWPLSGEFTFTWHCCQCILHWYRYSLPIQCCAICVNKVICWMWFLYGQEDMVHFTRDSLHKTFFLRWFDTKFASLYLNSGPSGQYQILHMSRQHSCHVMCKIWY